VDACTGRLSTADELAMSSDRRVRRSDSQQSDRPATRRARIGAARGVTPNARRRRDYRIATGTSVSMLDTEAFEMNEERAQRSAVLLLDASSCGTTQAHLASTG
jgi:hypothetical protein